MSLGNTSILHVVERLFRVEGLVGSGVLALAFAYALVSIVGSAALAAHFEYRFGGFLSRISRAVFESLIAAIGAAAGAYIFLEFFSTLDVSSISLSIFIQGFAAGLGGIIVAALTYYLLGSREYGETYASIRTRLWRKRDTDITLVSSAEQ